MIKFYDNKKNFLPEVHSFPKPNNLPKRGISFSQCSGVWTNRGQVLSPHWMHPHLSCLEISFNRFHECSHFTMDRKSFRHSKIRIHIKMSWNINWKTEYNFLCCFIHLLVLGMRVYWCETTIIIGWFYGYIFWSMAIWIWCYIACIKMSNEIKLCSLFSQPLRRCAFFFFLSVSISTNCFSYESFIIFYYHYHHWFGNGLHFVRIYWIQLYEHRTLSIQFLLLYFDVSVDLVWFFFIYIYTYNTYWFDLLNISFHILPYLLQIIFITTMRPMWHWTQFIGIGNARSRFGISCWMFSLHTL